MRSFSLIHCTCNLQATNLGKAMSANLCIHPKVHEPLQIEEKNNVFPNSVKASVVKMWTTCGMFWQHSESFCASSHSLRDESGKICGDIQDGLLEKCGSSMRVFPRFQRICLCKAALIAGLWMYFLIFSLSKVLSNMLYT